jgi:hypothetical protein
MVMSPASQVICSCMLTFGVPIALAGWDLWRLKPASWRPPPGEEAEPEPSPLPDAGRPPVVQKPLPDCLIPKRAPVRVPELV